MLGGQLPAAGHLPRLPIPRAEPVEITSAGHVYSFTVNHQRWLPDLEVPFAIVLVEFAEHPGVRVPGRLRGCHLDEVAIGSGSTSASSPDRAASRSRASWPPGAT